MSSVCYFFVVYCVSIPLLISWFGLQIIGYRTNLASQCAKERKWYVLHQSTLPLPSIAAFKLGGISASRLVT